MRWSLVTGHWSLVTTRGQSTLEYAVVIAVVVSAFLGMAVYLQRGFQGRLRQATEAIGPQYGPGLVVGGELTTLSSKSKQQAFVQVGGGTARTLLVVSSTSSDTTRARNETFTDNTKTGLFD